MVDPLGECFVIFKKDQKILQQLHMNQNQQSLEKQKKDILVFSLLAL